MGRPRAHSKGGTGTATADNEDSPSLRIFINYRRDDSAGHAGRLYDALVARFGEEQIFMDIDRIPLGVDFVEAISEAVGSCDVLIALVGRDWLSVPDSRGRPRLENPEDYVRLELEAALSRGVPVIPAQVQDAEMPSSNELPEKLAPFARRNGLPLRDIGWREDVGRLVRWLERMAEEKALRRREEQEARKRAAEEEAERERAELEARERAEREQAEREEAERERVEQERVAQQKAQQAQAKDPQQTEVAREDAKERRPGEARTETAVSVRQLVEEQGGVTKLSGASLLELLGVSGLTGNEREKAESALLEQGLVAEPKLTSRSFWMGREITVMAEAAREQVSESRLEEGKPEPAVSVSRLVQEHGGVTKLRADSLLRLLGISGLTSDERKRADAALREQGVVAEPKLTSGKVWVGKEVTLTAMRPSQREPGD